MLIQGSQGSHWQWVNPVTGLTNSLLDCAIPIELIQDSTGSSRRARSQWVNRTSVHIVSIKGIVEFWYREYSLGQTEF